MLQHELEHVSQAVKDLAEQKKDSLISLEEYKELRLNTYEREYLLPYWDGETLMYIVEHNLQHCQRHNKSVYDGVLHDQLVPEMLKRFKQLWEYVENYELRLRKNRESTWKPDNDCQDMTVKQMISHIYKKRLGLAVAPNGHTTPFLTTEEWTRIYNWSLDQSNAMGEQRYENEP